MRIKRIIAPVAAMMAMPALAGIMVPSTVFSIDFADYGEAGMTYLPAEWHTFGCGETPLEPYSEMFGEDGPYYVVHKAATYWGAYSNSSYVSNTPADEWLVTPPIHMESDVALLTFTAMATGTWNASEFRVMVSDKGFTPDDFTKAPVADKQLRSSEYSVNTSGFSAVVKGYAGKDVRLAFVNRSSDAGLLGFNNIEVAPYHVEIANDTPSVLPAGSLFNISMTATVSTPVVCSGLTAVLILPDGSRETLELNPRLTSGGTKVALAFPGEYRMPEDGFSYTVEILPGMEGAEAAVYTGTIDAPTSFYAPVVLVEEFTGSWCGNCPRGMAFMDYYHDRFNGADGQGRVIGVALHSNDMMSMTNPDYLNASMTAVGVTGYPGASFNREVGGDPSDVATVEQMMGRDCFSSIRIDRVDFHPGDEEIGVAYTVRNAFSRDDIGERVAFIVTESDVRGNNQGWNQANFLSGYSQQAVENTYGSELVPYFIPFISGSSTISYTDIAYEHVARGIYPDYNGVRLEGACEADAERRGSYTLPVDRKIINEEHINVVAVLLDADNGQVLSADETAYDRFNLDLTAVDALSADSGRPLAFVEGRGIRIAGENPVNVEIYGADGRILFEGALPGGGWLDMSRIPGFCIVRVVSGEESTVLKGVFRQA